MKFEPPVRGTFFATSNDECGVHGNSEKAHDFSRGRKSDSPVFGPLSTAERLVRPETSKRLV